MDKNILVETAKKMMNFKASNFLNKKGQPAKGLQESWTKLITEYDIQTK